MKVVRHGGATTKILKDQKDTGRFVLTATICFATAEGLGLKKICHNPAFVCEK